MPPAQRACFLDLKEKRVRFTGQKQQDATPGAYTSDTYNFDRNVTQFVMIQEKPAIFLHAFAIAGERRFDTGEKLLVLMLVPMIDQGWVILDLRQTADDFCELGKIMLSYAANARFA